MIHYKVPAGGNNFCFLMNLSLAYSDDIFTTTVNDVMYSMWYLPTTLPLQLGLSFIYYLIVNKVSCQVATQCVVLLIITFSTSSLLIRFYLSLGRFVKSLFWTNRLTSRLVKKGWKGICNFYISQHSQNSGRDPISCQY